MLVMRAGAPKLRIDELAFSPDGTGPFAPGLAAGLCHWPALSSGAKSDLLSLPTKVVKLLAFGTDATLYAGSDQLCAFDLGSKTGTLLGIPKWAGLWFGPSPDGRRLVVAENPQGSEGTRMTLWGAAASSNWGGTSA